MAELLNKLSFLAAIIALLKYCFLVANGEYYDWTTPIVIGAVLCKALNTSSSPSPYDSVDFSKNKTKTATVATGYHRFAQYINQNIIVQKLLSIYKSIECFVINDCHYNVIIPSIVFIFAPCTIFFVRRFVRHLSSEDDGSADHEELANDFGKLGAAALSFLLLPVSKHSPIFQALKLSEVHAIRMHIYAGSLAIFGGVMHGLYYTWIWIRLDEYTYQDVFPQNDCWVDLYNRDYGKSCHSKFINLLGIIAGLSFVVLGVMSLWWVRRRFYRVFYFIHATLSILILFCLVMHYNKMIYFLAPSLLYYMASNTPIFLESLYKSWWQGGVCLSKAVFIPDSGGCVELSLRLNDCIEDNMIGKYARLTVPSLSLKSHPFSIFSHPDHPGCIKVLFRPCGEFTHRLSKVIERVATSPEHTPSEIQHGLDRHGVSQIKAPKILINGVGTSSDQMEHVKKHDTIVIIAGGVGIVSYISLLSTLQSMVRLVREDSADNFDDEERSSGSLESSKRIIIHWMSRDEGLISHVMQNYFQPDQNNNCKSKPSLPIDFVVHHTGNQSEATIDSSSKYFTADIDTPEAATKSFASPYSIYDGNKHSFVQNMLPSLTLVPIVFGGLRVIDYCYDNIQDKHVVETRNAAVGGIVGLAAIISAFSFAVVKIVNLFFAKFSYSKVGKNESEIECGEIPSGLVDDDVLPHNRQMSSTLNKNSGSAIIISHSTGRPNLSAIISSAFDDAQSHDGKSVGIMMCGPKQLTNSVWSAITECREARDTTATILRGNVFQEVFEW